MHNSEKVPVPYKLSFRALLIFFCLNSVWTEQQQRISQRNLISKIKKIRNCAFFSIFRSSLTDKLGLSLLRTPSFSVQAAMRKEKGPLLICSVSSFKEIFYEGNDLHGLIGVCGVNSIG